MNHNLRSDYDKFTEDADPDTNALNIITSEYYMNEKVNTKLQNPMDGLSVIHINYRSLNAHFDQVKDLLINLESQTDVICLSKTWLTDTNCDLFSIPIYTFYFSNRQNKKGGG